MSTGTLRYLPQIHRGPALAITLFFSLVGLALLLTLAAPAAGLMVLAGGGDWGG